MKTGLCKISNKEYHANKQFRGSTTIKNWLENPLKAHYVDENGFKTTDTLVFGSYYHSFVLEPETVKEEFYFKEDMNLIEINEDERPDPTKGITAKVNKEWKAEIKLRNEDIKANFEQLNEYKDIFKIEKHDIVVAMKGTLFNYEKDSYSIKTMIEEHNRPEESFFCEKFIALVNNENDLDQHRENCLDYVYVDNAICLQKEDGRWLIYIEGIETDKLCYVDAKVRPDINTSAVIGDLKTCVNNSIKKWQNQVKDFDYDCQAAWYRDVYFVLTGKLKPFLWVTQEKSEPYNVEVYNAANWLEGGRNKYLKGCVNILKYQATGELLGYNQTNSFAIDIDRPSWA